MDSLYAQYLKERTSDHIVEADEGFVTYRYINNDKTVYIVDIFVRPELRNQKLATVLADRVVALAKEKGCKELIGSVVPSTKGSTTSLKVLLGYGMFLSSAANDFIVFRKEI